MNVLNPAVHPCSGAEFRKIDPHSKSNPLLCSADGMLFGPLGVCPLCASPMEYKEGHYCCRGFLSEWTKCTHTTQEAPRLKAQWKLPEDNDNEYLDEVGVGDSAGLLLRFASPFVLFGDVSARNLPKDSKCLNDVIKHPCFEVRPFLSYLIVDWLRMIPSSLKRASLKLVASPLLFLPLEFRAG
jgi:hypothetical protein